MLAIFHLDNWTTDCFCFQSMQDEMMDLMDVSSEIQESLGRSYNVPDDIDEDDLMGGMLKLYSYVMELWNGC